MYQLLWSVLAITFVLGIVGALALVRRSTKSKTPPTEPIHFTFHARERMEQRGVSQREIEQTLMAPELQRPDDEQGSLRFEKTFLNRKVIVWVVASGSTDHEFVVKSTAARCIIEILIPAGAAGHIIGKNGKNVKAITEHTQVRLNVSDSSVRIEANKEEEVQSVKRKVEALIAEYYRHGR